MKEKGKNDFDFDFVGAKWFCCAFKLGFLQLICSLISKSNLELALSNMRPVILFDLFLNLVLLKWQKSPK